MRLLPLLLPLLALPATAQRSVPGQPYVSHTTTDSLGRTITFYLSENTDATALVIYIQGSGAQSHFVQDREGRIRGSTGHNTIQDVFADTARVMLVEKPGVTYLDNPPNVEAASPMFHAEHTLDRWAIAIRAAIASACARAPCDRVVVIGHSEGGVVAARVAATAPRVTHVAILAGEGPPQLYSLIALARAGTFFAELGDTADEREAWLLNQWALVLAEPDRSDRFFFGHPYRRWSSFLGTSPVEELARVTIPMFVAQGTADQAVAPASADVLHATLLARGKAVCYRRIDGADHSFHLPGRNGWSEIMAEIRRWAMAQRVQSVNTLTESQDHPTFC